MADLERKIEQIVNDKLIELGYSKDQIEFGKSTDDNINKLLVSKNSNTKGSGKIEFIIKLRGIASDLLIIECKNEESKHCSNQLTAAYVDGVIDTKSLKTISQENIKNYAEDGVLHYMSYLSEQYNVIGLAISGSKLKTTTFIQKRGEQLIKKEKPVSILSIKGYHELIRQNTVDINTENIDYEINKALPKIHNYLRDVMELGEQEKPLLISSVLLSLMDSFFSDSWRTINTNEKFVDQMLLAIRHKLNDSGVPDYKINMMMTSFEFIKEENIKKHLRDLVSSIDYLFSGIKFDKFNYDIMGSFYNEFLKYTGGDKQGLGIVLTPKHITEFFSEIAEINKDSVVLDTCTGTGGFLISAMTKMIDDAKLDDKKIADIKEKQLIGIEFKKEMFTLACSNMILRNDGKANMFNMSCFDLDFDKLKEYDDLKNLNPTFNDEKLASLLNFTKEQMSGIKALSAIKKLKPTKCLINPPYSKKEDSLSELSFIKKGLDLLEPNGTLVAIVPISCAIENNKKTIEWKEAILKEHTLESVLSMPDQLFPGVGTVTCVMIFTAKKPHKPNNKVYFGYYKDDGFKLSKNNRYPIIDPITKKNKWEDEIKIKWINNYIQKTENIPGFCKSVSNVTHNDEWCAEAYMDTDFKKINDKDFIQNLQTYNSHLYLTNILTSVGSERANNTLSSPKLNNKFSFFYKDIFNVEKPQKANTYNLASLEDGNINFVTASERNNGIAKKVNTTNNSKGNAITVASNGSVGEAFYQLNEFSSTADINIIRLKEQELDPYLAFYFITLIKAEKFKYSYGRKWGKDRMITTKMELPITNEYSEKELSLILLDFDYLNLNKCEQYINDIKKLNNSKLDTLKIEECINKLKTQKITSGDIKNLDLLINNFKSQVVKSSIDFDFIREYIKSLPHSKSLDEINNLLQSPSIPKIQHK